ncbi:MAG: outer membrane protein assembly factor BamA [Candidatus Cloacimonetes bacterium]|nr:outer membrane protein assembly factor BamA [Candidatus Cloacimonadota bacterium]
MLKYSRIVILIGILLIAGNLLSQTASSSDLILEIQVTGNENIETALIIATMNVEIGRVLAEERIALAIRNLNQLGVFNNIEIRKTAITGGIRLIVDVEEFPIVESVRYEGNRRIRNSKLDEIVTIRTGTYLAPFLLVENRNRIIDEYKKVGYNFASVDYEVLDQPDNRVNLDIVIDEGERIAVRSINFYGNRGVTDRQLLRRMKTKRASLLRSGRFQQDQFDEDLKNIIKYYNDNGFIDARIVSWETNVPESRYMQIDIYLHEGRQYFFGDIYVRGNRRFTDEIILEKFRFKEDEIFNLEKFNRQVGQVASLYYEEGYIYAGFEHEMQRVEDRINIFLDITENTRAKIRKIFITGNYRTKEKVIRRQLAIAPGDYFRQSRVIRTQQNIYNLGFFEPNIRLDYQPINREGDIDLLIELEDKHSGSANAGVGYNSQDGFIGQLSLSHNNLFGNAWQSSVSWEFGGSTQNFTFDFTNPHFLDTFTLVGFNIYHARRDWSSFNYKVFTTGGSIRAGRSLFFLDNSRLVGNYSYYRKKYEVINPDAPNTSAYLLELDRLGWRDTSSFSLTFSRDSRDNIYYPTSGSHLIFFSELAGGPLGGDFDYFKQILQSTWYTRTFWRLVLRSKWRFGYVTAYGRSDEVPPDERFYLGGTGPDGLRGYVERSIPGRGSEGGLRAIIHSTEFTVPIAGDQITGLLFFDAGNTFNRLEDFNFYDFKKGTGLGIRIHSPLGLIGFDYGYNLETRKWEPHFQFGTTF